MLRIEGMKAGNSCLGARFDKQRSLRAKVKRRDDRGRKFPQLVSYSNRGKSRRIADKNGHFCRLQSELESAAADPPR